MANRYWVGGTGSWQDTTKWSDISGGTGGFSVPTVDDDVYINGDSDAGSPFEIRLSNNSTLVNSFKIENLEFSLSFSFFSFRELATYSFNILDNKVYLNGKGNGYLGLYNTFVDAKTCTYNCIVPLHNLEGIYFINVKLQSDLSISHSSTSGYNEFIIDKNFYCDNKILSFKNIGDCYASFYSEGSINSTITYINRVINSKIIWNGAIEYTGLYFYYRYKHSLLDWTNTVISVSGNGVLFEFNVQKNRSYILPSINVVDTGDRYKETTQIVFSTPDFVDFRKNTETLVKTTEGIISKLSYTSRTADLNYPALIGIRTGTGCYLKIGELAISASSQNRVILSGFGRLDFLYGYPNQVFGSIFIESASLSQVIFHKINVLGFREQSVSFSASNIGWFNTFAPHNRNIKFPAPKTVYWNNTVGGNFYSNSFTSATGGTVTTTWIPFPQDIVKITNAGLNSSATISLNIRGKNNIFPSITSLERSLPMSWTISLSSNPLYFSGFLKIPSNNTIGGVYNIASGLFNFYSGTFNIAPRLNFALSFNGDSPKFLKSKLDSGNNISIEPGTTIDFGENSISCSRISILKSIITNPPLAIKACEQVVLQTNLPNTELYFRNINSLGNYIRGSAKPSGVSDITDTTKIKSIYLEGGSFSYSVSLVGLTIDNLIYNKIGNINISLNPTALPVVVKRLKMMGVPNGSITASIRFSSTSTSLTAVITYAGVDTAASLSFVEFTRVVLGPKRDAAGTYRVFAGTRSTTTPANNGPWYTDKPKITNVNAGNDVLSSSKINIITDVTLGFFPVFSVKYKDVTITDLSLNNSTTYVATFPNYFANNIKVGAKHELKIIRGN